MKGSNLQVEKRYWKKGKNVIIGVDEAGRGCVAGPVVAGAVFVSREIVSRLKNPKYAFLSRIRDSKKIKEEEREKLYEMIKKIPEIIFATGKVSSQVIDKINILEATKLAMKRALGSLRKKLLKKGIKKIDLVILDGKMKIETEIKQKAVIRADDKIFSCSLASIVAKVSRDRLMRKIAALYPQYNFSQNKGYLTKEH
ncbi:MAG: ribonuclease HII, partial [Candidatus Aenigmarchaeota archaeon]|nr:ribonuclease HII [Candidatus Aenigmarchaeota archaeon]